MTTARRTWSAVCGGGLVSILLAASVEAHHGPNKVIDDLSHRMIREGSSAELLARRGDEYRALGKLPDSTADYEAALVLDEDYLPALYGLAQVYIDREKVQLAQGLVERAVQSAADANQAAAFHALLAQIHEKEDRCELALESWDRALASSRPEVDWFLGKAQLLWKLQQPEAAEQSLCAAMKRNPSEALKRAWYESLVRSGKLDQAQSHVEYGLSKSRWKSSWLLLRARLHAARGSLAEARQDALAALAEIDQRLQPRAPNPFLTADKAQALAMLGRDKEALEQAKTARSLGVPAWKLSGVEVPSPSIE